MPSDLTLTIDSVTFLNDTNELTVTILLEDLWNTLIEYDYLYVNVYLRIPITSDPSASLLLLDLHQEYLVSTLSSITRQVTLTTNFGGIIDTQRTLEGASTINCYNKSTTA